MAERSVTIEGETHPLPILLRRRDAEPRRVRGHLPAPRVAARPLHDGLARDTRSGTRAPGPPRGGRRPLDQLEPVMSQDLKRDGGGRRARRTPSRAISWTSWPRAIPSSSSSVRAPARRSTSTPRRGTLTSTAVRPSFQATSATSRPPCSASRPSGHGRAVPPAALLEALLDTVPAPRLEDDGSLRVRRRADRPAPPTARRGRSEPAPRRDAGIILAVFLGALPAALVGLEIAWLIVVAGRRPWPCPFARRQAASVEVAGTPRYCDSTSEGRRRSVSNSRHVERAVLLDVRVDGSAHSGGSPRLAVPRLRAASATRGDPRRARGARTSRRRPCASPRSVLAGAHRAPPRSASHGAAAPARPGRRARRALRTDDPRASRPNAPPGCVRPTARRATARAPRATAPATSTPC